MNSAQYATAEFRAPSSTAEPKSLYRISSAPELFAWLRGPFLALSYPPEHSSDALVFQNNRVVGGIRIGQLRVSRADCSARVTSYFGSTPTESSTLFCYGAARGDFDASDEFSEPFGGDDGSAFPFAGLNGTDTLSERRGHYASMRAGSQELPAPAFSVVLPRADSAQAAQILAWLERSSYVDANTRVVMLDVNLFNAMLRRVLALRFVFEFPASGGVVPSVVATSAPLTKSFLFDAEQLSASVCNLLVLCFYVYFLVSELLAHTGRRRKTAALKALKWSSRFGSTARALSLLFYVLVWLARLVALINFPSVLPLESDAFVSLRGFVEPFRAAQHLLAVNTCLCWLVLLLLLRVSKNVDVFVRTVLLAKTKLLSLLICTALLVYGYASALVVAIGGSHGSQGYQSVGAAARSLLGLALGVERRQQQPWPSHLEPDATIRSALLVGFLLLHAFVLANLFLVVIYEAYRQALADAEFQQQQSAHKRVHIVIEIARYAKALYLQLREKLAHLRGGRRAKKVGGSRLAVVRAISSSKAIQKSAKLISTQVSALSDFGGKLVHTVVSSEREDEHDSLAYGGSSAEFLRATNARGGGGSPIGRRSPERSGGGNAGGGGGDVSTKLLQGMILQLALQNESLLRSLDEVRGDVKHLTALSSMDGTSRHALLSPASQTRLGGKRKQSSMTHFAPPSSRSEDRVELLETLS